MFFRDYVRMIVQFYEMFDAKCWHCPESVDHGDRRAIVIHEPGNQLVRETRRDRRKRMYRESADRWQREHT
jgi:hypothetical protein